MKTVTLNEMDLRAFVTAFNSIAEVADYNFDAETEYRLAIANLVGALKEQLAPTREMISITPRANLAALLEDKYRAWNAECASGALCQSAADLVGEFLIRQTTIAGNSPAGLVLLRPSSSSARS